jgi:arabinan endo-1,5-alpha-L-arabinosidase
VLSVATPKKLTPVASNRILQWMSLALILMNGLAATSPTNVVPPNVHDPCAIASHGYFYVYSTGRGIPMWRSTDLLHWDRLGRVFDTPPDWAVAKVPTVKWLWAPDISFFNGAYHLYYCASTFGTNQSAIGLALNKTLDPADPNYRWADQGMVLESKPSNDFNAIDPNLIIDEHGTPWLTLGSCWSGIKLVQIDSTTGKPSATNRQLIAIAARPHNAIIEAPFIVHHGPYYYLFVSFDACCKGADSTYRTVVGRAEQITGPYEDMDRIPMIRGGGSPVLSSQGNIRGPGHNGMLMNVDGKDWIVHHFYDAADKGISKLQVRPITWDANDWPLAGEPVNAAVNASIAKPLLPSRESMAGDWQYSVNFGDERVIHLTASGSIEGADGSSWNLQGMKLSLGWPDGKGKMRWDTCTIGDDASWFVGRDAEGNVVRGRRSG